MRNSISIDIHVEQKPKIEIEAEEKPALEISVKNAQVVTYYDLIFEEI